MALCIGGSADGSYAGRKEAGGRNKIPGSALIFARYCRKRVRVPVHAVIDYSTPLYFGRGKSEETHRDAGILLFVAVEILAGVVARVFDEPLDHCGESNRASGYVQRF